MFHYFSKQRVQVWYEVQDSVLKQPLVTWLAYRVGGGDVTREIQQYLLTHRLGGVQIANERYVELGLFWCSALEENKELF